MQTVYNLYASQIAAILWTYEGGDGSGRRPVVVGLALKRSKAAADSALLADGAGDEETGGAGEASEEDRELFKSVMEMVKEVLG
ncbi:hypothetical protein FRC01_013628 [Tulasnella sp. 417]|nr:hypothetical protein FRC01_013628 [Tulasnella sp. 417]